MKKTPVISVVIPAYNKGELLRATISSALAQDFTDYEIIVIDDGSTDNCKAIVTAFTDPRVRYFYQANSGLPAAARNSGIRHSGGEYIAFLDADDVWHREKLSKCYEAFKKHPGIGLVCHKEIIKDVSGNVVRMTDLPSSDLDVFRKLLFSGNCLSPSATVVRKEALLEIGAFREYPEFFSVEDYDLWIRLSKRNRFFFLPEILGEYLLHDMNISSDTERHYNNQVAVIKKNFEEYEGRKTFDRFLVNIRISRIYLIIARSFLRKRKIAGAFKYFLTAMGQVFNHA